MPAGGAESWTAAESKSSEWLAPPSSLAFLDVRKLDSSTTLDVIFNHVYTLIQP